MVESFIEALRSIGELGVLLIAILDSSFISIPEVNDLIVVANVAERPDLLFYWPFITTSGSVIGSFILYWLARKGGQRFLYRWFPTRRVKFIERVFAKYGALALIIPALCPPPTPFKIFVASAGAFQYPVKRFIMTIVLARSVRYYSAGVLAVLYGKKFESFIKQHALMVALIIIAVVTLLFFVVRMVEARLLRRKEQVKVSQTAKISVPDAPGEPRKPVGSPADRV